MKKLPIIRHVRYFILKGRIQKYVDACARAGLGLGVPNEYDSTYLQKVWEGKE